MNETGSFLADQPEPPFHRPTVFQCPLPHASPSQRVERLGGRWLFRYWVFSATSWCCTATALDGASSCALGHLSMIMICREPGRVGTALAGFGWSTGGFACRSYRFGDVG